MISAYYNARPTALDDHGYSDDTLSSPEGSEGEEVSNESEDAFYFQRLPIETRKL